MKPDPGAYNIPSIFISKRASLPVNSSTLNTERRRSINGNGDLSYYLDKTNNSNKSFKTLPQNAKYETPSAKTKFIQKPAYTFKKNIKLEDFINSNTSRNIQGPNTFSPRDDYNNKGIYASSKYKNPGGAIFSRMSNNASH